ncbi:hypothetical protein GGR56DRAFT_623530 [Xylariaceae sp. FL0804]|nr:hypothetical protein GGR56DRAFT_623530 [Xylariaceae sp. FL0804]
MSLSRLSIHTVQHPRVDNMQAAVITSNSKSGGLVIRSETLKPQLTDGQIFVRFHLSSINPLDVAVLAGVYPVKPLFTVESEPILGFDGVAEVVEIGPGVENLSTGDLVVPARYGVGTWRSHAVLDAQLVDKIPQPKDTTFPALLRLSVVTAYLLVEDMRNLQPGEWVAFNAATSTISQMAIQFAKRKGARVISVIRDREDASAEFSALKRLGSDLTVTQSELDKVKVDGPLVLAIDSVGGEAGLKLVQFLSPGGTYVPQGFLGGMARPSLWDTRTVWQKQITVAPFRASSLLAKRSHAERKGLLAWLVDLYNAGELHLPALQLEFLDWDRNASGSSIEAVQQKLRILREGVLGNRKVLIRW